MTKAQQRSMMPGLIVLALMLWGCSSVTPSYAYRLSAANGLTLPAVIHEEVVQDEAGEALHQLVLTEGTLRLQEGRYRHSYTLLYYVGGNLAGRDALNDHGFVERQGERLQFESNHIQNLGFTGMPRENGVTLDYDFYLHVGEHHHASLSYTRLR